MQHCVVVSEKVYLVDAQLLSAHLFYQIFHYLIVCSLNYSILVLVALKPPLLFFFETLSLLSLRRPSFLGVLQCFARFILLKVPWPKMSKQKIIKK